MKNATKCWKTDCNIVECHNNLCARSPLLAITYPRPLYGPFSIRTLIHFRFFSILCLAEPEAIKLHLNVPRTGRHPLNCFCSSSLGLKSIHTFNRRIALKAALSGSYADNFQITPKLFTFGTDLVKSYLKAVLTTCL